MNTANVIWLDNEKRWSLRVSIGGIKKRFTSSTPGIAGKKEVLKKYREFVDGSHGSVTYFSEAWKLFLEFIISKNGANSDSYINHEKYGRNYILPAVGKKLTQSVSLIDLQNIINHAQPVSGKACLSKKTLTNLRASITQFYRFASANGLAEPLRGELYIPKTAPKREKDILQPDELSRLFAGSSNGDWYINIFRFAAVTGLRTGEILGIKRDDIKDGILTISRSINARNDITPGKNRNAQRKIYLNKIAQKIVNENLFRNARLSTEWVFCNKIGAPLSQSTLRNNWIRIAKERGLSGSPYSLRHTFISYMANSDLPEPMLKAIVGHGVNMDSYGIYGHIVNGDLKQAAEIIDVRFGSFDI